MALPKRAYTADYADLNHAVQSGMQQGSGGAARAYRGQARQSGTAGAYGGQAYPSYAPYPQRERRVKAWEERNLPKPQPQNAQNAQSADTGILTRAVLAKTVAVLIFAGILLIATVFLTAKATEIKYSINSTMRQNAALQKEIDVLEVKIGSANSIESIEQYATEKLGMRYPKAGQSIYLTIDRAANKDLVQRIKEKAYRE